ncbi:MAG: tetratricopeptide repeat protein [Terracidiphilus sp.]|jgi:hypothetical protein
MKRGVWITVILAGGLAMAQLCAQAQAGGDAAGSGQSKPAADAQKPAAAPPSGANPFPEDTNSVPVLPTKDTPMPSEAGSADFGRIPLPGEDADPVRSPDDAAPAAGSAQDQNSSSSLAGLDTLLPKPEDDQPGRKGKLTVKEPTHKEAAATDINVGQYYLERKDWKAALSRFESAMVLDPENPEVYWGLAESERHLGNLADARAYYAKLLDYDPDGPHGKQARKVMKDPALAAAQNPASAKPAADSPR